MLYEILKVLARVVMVLLFRLRTRGRQHVPREGGLIIVANHSSFLDPPMIGCVVPRQLTYLAKEELFRIPLLGRLIHAVNARPLRRGGADLRAMRAAFRVLEEGGALLVFPEGTRGDEGVLRDGKAGAGMLAVVSGVPVVPAYVEGSGRAWPRGRSLPRPSTVRVTFGPPVRLPLPTQGAGRKERYEAASRAMMDAIGRIARESGARLAQSPGTEFAAVDGAGRSALGRPKYTHGRNGQHG